MSCGKNNNFHMGKNIYLKKSFLKLCKLTLIYGYDIYIYICTLTSIVYLYVYILYDIYIKKTRLYWLLKTILNLLHVNFI